MSRLLKGITVIELSGLAPGPLCGQILADYGARVIRIDRPPSAGGQTLGGSAGRNPDQLVRGKQSVALDLRSPKGQKALRTILESGAVDVLIDTYRPGVLERLNILPTKRPQNNNSIGKSKKYYKKPPLIVARLTGYGQSGSLASFAGHDINYLAQSGVLSVVGPPGAPPAVPANILGDFAALSLPGFAAIVTALFSGLRNSIYDNDNDDIQGSDSSNSKENDQLPYTIIDVNIVDSLKYLAQFVTFCKYGPYIPESQQTPEIKEELESFTPIVQWGAPRGMNVLEGYICPFYTIYATADNNEYVSVGALEPQFYREFLKLIMTNDGNSENKEIQNLPDRNNPTNWKALKEIFSQKFKQHGIKYWEKRAAEFPDSCVMPVAKLAKSSEIPNQIVNINNSNINSTTTTESTDLARGFILTPGRDTNEILDEFLGTNWKEEYGSDFASQSNSKSKL